MFLTDNPLRDFDRYDMAMARREARLPVCEKCGERINDDEFFDVHGDIYCEECMKEEFGRSTEDYLRDSE